jgi:hypothetical protein
MHEYSSSIKKSTQHNSNSKSNNQKVDDKKSEAVLEIKEAVSDTQLEEEKKARW